MPIYGKTFNLTYDVNDNLGKWQTIDAEMAMYEWTFQIFNGCCLWNEVSTRDF